MVGPQEFFDSYVSVSLHLLQYAATVTEAADAYLLAKCGLQRCGHRCYATRYSGLT